MSQRSHIAISGRTAIWPCSVACRAPSSTSGGSGAGDRVSDHVPERLGGEVLLGQLQGDDVERLLVGDRDRWKAVTCSVTEISPKWSSTPAHLAALLDPLDVDLGLLLRPGEPVIVEAAGRPPGGPRCRALDLVGAAEVQVDRPGVDRGEGALGLDQAEHLARVALDHRDGVGRGGAQRDPGGDEAASPRQAAGRRPGAARRRRPAAPPARASPRRRPRRPPR